MKSKAAKEVDAAQKKTTIELFKNIDLSQYAIRGSEDDWKSALASGPQGTISVKRLLTCYLFIKFFLLTSLSLPFSELSLVGLALCVVD